MHNYFTDSLREAIDEAIAPIPLKSRDTALPCPKYGNCLVLNLKKVGAIASFHRCVTTRFKIWIDVSKIVAGLTRPTKLEN